MAEREQSAPANGEDQDHLERQADRRPASDVELDVPNLQVDDIHLDVEEMRAHVALDATVAENLVRIRAGVDVDLGKVQLELKGVEAEAHLRVKLDNIARIVEEAFVTLREVPGITAAINGADSERVQQIGASAANSRRAEPADTARRVLEDVGVTGRTRRIRQTSKAAARKLKRGVAQVTGQLTSRLGAPNAAY